MYVSSQDDTLKHQGNLSFSYLQLMSVFLQRSPLMRLQLYVTDNRGYRTPIYNNQLLQAAFSGSTCKGDLLKLHVEVLSDYPNLSLCRHPDARCVFCDRPMAGKRFVCTTCPDVVFCWDCETKRLHSEHLVVRLAQRLPPVPYTWKEPSMSPFLFTNPQPVFCNESGYFARSTPVHAMDTFFRSASCAMDKAAAAIAKLPLAPSCDHRCDFAKQELSEAKIETREGFEDNIREIYV